MCDSYEIPADIQSNSPILVNILLVSTEDIADMLNLLKGKRNYVSGTAVFDEDSGFIEIESKQIPAYL